MKRLVAAAVVVAGFASIVGAQAPDKPNTFWILGPFGVEHQLGQSERPSTVALYLAGIFKKDDSFGGDSSTLKLGLAGEYLVYSAPNASGLGIGGRVYATDGISIGPSVAYVTRPKNGVAFRLGASFPFGADAVPFNVELGIGFRF